MSNRPTTDTSANSVKDKPKFPEDRVEPSLPVFIPMRMVRWVLYSFVFMLLLVPFVSGLQYDGAKAACGGMILGWFASQLNALINKK